MELAEVTEIFETLQGTKHRQEFDELIHFAIK